MKKGIRTLSVLLLLAAAGRVSAQTVFVGDLFSGTNGTTLQAHTPNSGGAWMRVVGSNLNIQTNALRATATNAGDLYTNATAAPSANYEVGMYVTFTNNNANNYINVIGRGSVTAQNGYLAQLQANGAVIVWPVVGGVIGAAIINTTTTVTLNVQHLFVLEMLGNKIAAYVDGTQFGPVTNNAVTAAGVVGLGLNANNTAQVTADGFFAGTLAVTEARMQSMTARRHAGRTLLEWTTSRESENLGFRVWRQDGSRRTRVTPSLIAGSTFLTDATLTAGGRYRWLDGSATPHSRYWIESVSVGGRSEWSGPIMTRDEPFDSAKVRSPILRELHPRITPASVRAARTVVATDTRRAVAPPDTLSKQQELAASTALKISVDSDGWYRVPRDELLAAGLAPEADPARLHLYADAREVAMVVEGESDVEGIRFYGTALDTPSTATHVYWLTSEDGIGRRMATGSPAGGGVTPSSFLAVAERRDKAVFFAALANGENDSFFGPVITNDASSPATQTLRLEHLDRTSPNADLEIALQGATDFGADPSHVIAVTLNGQPLDDIRFSGRDDVFVHRIIPSEWLLEGDNTFTFAAKNGEGDVSLVSFVRLTYAHTYELDGGALMLTADGGDVAVRGATPAGVHALDITAPASPVELPVTIDNGIARFHAAGGRRTIIVTSNYAKPVRVDANRPSTLHAAKAADLVILVHPSLVSAVEPLRALRESQGLSVVVASVDDVYDEYGCGAKDPGAIRTFLASTAPRYVLLVGDASLDARNYLGLDEGDLVPTKLIVTPEMKTASDSWLTDFDDDGFADAGIGRLPVRTLDEARLEIGKIVAYENATAAPDWSRAALLVSDDDAALDFDALAQRVRDVVPDSYTTESIRVSGSGETAARQDLLSRFDRGALLVDYIGHGSAEVWRSGGLFVGSDAATLKNGNRLPFVVAMTCLNGYFHDVSSTSLAEALLAAPNGGAIGVFASSSVTDAHAQGPANEELVRALLADHATLGEAMLAAQRHATDANVRRTFLLFGDPSMRLR